MIPEMEIIFEGMGMMGMEQDPGFLNFMMMSMMGEDIMDLFSVMNTIQRI